MISIRMMPIKAAQSREYHGPSSTEQIILIRCAIGHIPSTRRIGEIITPTAISSDRTASLRTASVFFIAVTSFPRIIKAELQAGALAFFRRPRARPLLQKKQKQETPLHGRLL